MTWIQVSTMRAAVASTRRRSTPRNTAQSCWRLVRSGVAAFLSLLVAGGPLSPAFAQNPPQDQNPPQQQNPAPQPSTPSAPQAPTQQAYTQTATRPPIPISLGVSKYNYKGGPRTFPNLLAAYRSLRVPEPVLTNSPRIDQLIHDNKLELSLQDAVELALENSMDIAVQRYYPWLADLDILAAESGALPQGVPGSSIRFSQANIPFLNFDPTITSSLFYDHRTIPVNNPLTSGSGTSTTAAALFTHTAQYQNQYQQGFSPGTLATVQWNNTRSSSSSTFNFFNPDVSSSFVVSIQQQLLNGFGRFANRRNIIIAKNNRKLADYAFEQQAITTVTNTITAYWELVYARENVVVEQQAVAVSQKLYNDNQKQLEIGTMAPLDVTRAGAQLALDRQNLIIAQTVQLQDEQILKNAISKDPLAANLINVELIPLDKPTPPEKTEAASFEDAVKEAFTKRPELLEQAINVQNAKIETRATAIALRPVASAFGQYTSQGLAGDSPVVDATGKIIGINRQGFPDSQSQVFHNKFPDYLVGLNLTIPIRNRAAQATNTRALLDLRQIETILQQLKNAAVLDVRNSYIALEQDRAQVEAASKQRELQQQTFDAEQKKYQLGASTVFLVTQTLRDLVNAQGAELRALANLVEAKANYERAVGRTLEVNSVSIADAKHGEIERDTLIPGTLHGTVVGTEDLFKDGSLR